MTFARRASTVGAVATVVALTMAACSTATEPDTADRTTATAEAFLDTYVDAGRVVRTDQGGDTVSEGQAYGLLLAVAADDPSRFDSIWEWTTTH
ncbi:glycosyl hydrolase family 8, partial [uncultured Microbacterium sp.]